MGKGSIRCNRPHSGDHAFFAVDDCNPAGGTKNDEEFGTGWIKREPRRIVVVQRDVPCIRSVLRIYNFDRPLSVLFRAVAAVTDVKQARAPLMDAIVWFALVFWS